MTDNLGSVPGSGNKVQYYNVQAASPLSSTPLVSKTGCLKNKKIIDRERDRKREGRKERGKRKKRKVPTITHTDMTLLYKTCIIYY